MTFDGDPVVGCDSTIADSTHRGKITVKLLNLPVGGDLRITLYQQTTLVATMTGTPATFTGLADGAYRVDAYAVRGGSNASADTCRAGTRTLTVRCASGPLNIRIKSVDSTGTETDLLPRKNGGLGTLNLSVEELDGQDLTGYTYLWTEPVSTSVTTSTATSTTLTARRIGEYKVTLTNGSDTLVAYTTLRAKPCRQVAHTYACGTAPAAPIADAGSPGLSNLAPGDTIRTGDFDVIVTEVLGGGSGGWTGKGYTEIPYLVGQRIAIDFTNANVNDCYEYTGGGTVQSAFDANWGNVINLDSTRSQANQDPNKSLARLQDALETFTGTTADKQKIDGYFADLKSQLLNDPSITDQQRTDALEALSQAETAWDSLKICSSAGGRIAASGARTATAASCSKESVKAALQDVYNSTTGIPCECITDRPTVPGTEGQMIPVSGGSACVAAPGVGVVPRPCKKMWYYFAGASNSPLLRGMTQPAISDWSAGWYSFDDYIARVRRVIRAIVISTNDVRALAPGTDVATEVNLFNEFTNTRTLSDNFLTSIAPAYESIRRGADFTVTGSGAIEPVYIEFEALTLFTATELKAIVRASAGLAKAGLLGAKKAYISTRLAAQLNLAKVGSDGVLREVQWARYADYAASNNSIELKGVKYLNENFQEEIGDILILKFSKGQWAITEKWRYAISKLKGAKGLIGKDYEEYLAQNLLDGKPSFTFQGRDFDGKFNSGQSWFEAKSGQYWASQTSTESGFAKFKSDMGARLKIATSQGVDYVLFSNTPIPNEVKNWLQGKGIQFFETLN